MSYTSTLVLLLHLFTFLMYTAHVHFFTNLDLFCIDNARVIYRKIRYIKYNVWRLSVRYDPYMGR